MRHIWLASVAWFVGFAALACGKDVDLGGAPDASLPEASLPEASLPEASLPEAGDAPPEPQACDPCETAKDCAELQTCAQFGGDTFCAPICPLGNECSPTDVCKSLTTAADASTKGCIPSGGSCTPAVGPVSDAGPLERCGALNGPNVASPCHSCGRFSNDCQKNGCYGGWWCNTTTVRCVSPPRTCAP
jgi:hypothetical protein